MCRSQGQFGRSVQNTALLGRKPALVGIRLNHSLTRVGRHGPERVYRRADGLTAVWGKLLHLLVYLPCRIFLCRRQVFPCLHPVEDALLFFRRTAVEMIKPFAKLFLPLGWKLAELRIILQGAALLLRG